MTGCATGPRAGAETRWPTADVLPGSEPEGLETEAPTSVLRRGSDGFLYVVGDVPSETEPGDPFLVRYAGDWPLKDTPRPALAAGRVSRTVGESAALVHLSYRMPDTEIEGQEVTWEEKITADTVGKGIGQIAKVNTDGNPTVKLQMGKDPGLQAGDIYAILAPPSQKEGASALSTQLSRRFKGICMVKTTDDSSADCILGGRFSADSNQLPARQDHALFLTHAMPKEARNAVIQIGGLGDEHGAVRQQLVEVFESTADQLPEQNIDVATSETSFDASRDDFHRVASKVEYAGKPQMFVGATVKERDGADHLIVNYTGVGPATGPGMVAAPPTGGVDLGPVDDLKGADLRPFASVVWGGMLVYRGQNARALAHLHHLLGNPKLVGPLRWHTRDQYAMRWGSLGNYEESLWLVLQDEAVADDNREARLNAMGTRVRLYDFVGLTDKSVEMAAAYLEEQQQAKPGTPWLSAVGMHAELQAAAGNIAEAKGGVETLIDQCPDGCGGDLFSYLSSVWWSIAPDEDPEFSASLLSRMVGYASKERGRRLAAARLYQGVESLRQENYDQALIAFLESKRLYEKHGVIEGKARALYFGMLSEIQREKNQNAFELGQEAIELRKEMRDFEGIARIYERMSALYTNVDFRKRPGPYLRSARSILTEGFQAQRALGSEGKAAESLYTLGTFLFQFGQNRSATVLFQKAVGFSLDSTRFDVAALSHLYLAMIARRGGDKKLFQKEISRARLMGDVADSPQIDKLIERIMNPQQDQKPDVPTQVL
jgi:tetratricopeptide (TPR) repeat protein